VVQSIESLLEKKIKNEKVICTENKDEISKVEARKIKNFKVMTFSKVS